MNIASNPPGTGQWIGASYALGRPVSTGEPYPHICGVTVTGSMTGVTVRLRERHCAACAAQHAPAAHSGQPGGGRPRLVLISGTGARR